MVGQVGGMEQSGGVGRAGALDRRSGEQAFGPAEELDRVLTEIAEALHGTGTVLTMHVPGGVARIVHVVGDPELHAIMEPVLASGALDYRQDHADHHLWLPGTYGRYAEEVIALPVRRVPGHSRMMITVFFDTLADERRAAAESAFLARRPFAVGYFRLWQQERLRSGELDAARAALDRMGTAVMLIDRAGGLTFANYAARKLLADGDGLREQNGRLRANDRADGIALETSLEHILYAHEDRHAPQDVPILRIRRNERAPLVVAVLPATVSLTEEGAVAALVFAVDPDMDIRDLALPVCRAFNLTRVETDLVCELASGLNLREAATKLRMKEATARTYLKTIFSKTGTNRQADLVRSILVSLVRAVSP